MSSLHQTADIVPRAPQLLCYSFFGKEFGILKWNFHVLFPVYFNVNHSNKMEFNVKFATFSILKWNFQNIIVVIVGLYLPCNSVWVIKI